MKFVVILVCVVLLATTANCQMTFTDQWSKKRAMLRNKGADEIDSSWCGEDKQKLIFEEIVRLQKAQTLLIDRLNECSAKKPF
ncbi:unnamed protein product [Caenorhabditis bovis]|uniref:Uncharacterized protein n=1 Tax=Caenorhabditis bovis TaxID=2654633 RepID=A0A8S1ET56_9PELO|nr:unnamed protein product [Caenorhabditis bovis]